MRSKREMEGIQSAYYALNASGDALSSAHGPQIANWRSASWGRRKGSAGLLDKARAPPRAKRAEAALRVYSQPYSQGLISTDAGPTLKCFPILR